MAERKIPKLSFEGVRLAFKNFEGKEGPYNRAGDRSFAIMIDDEELAYQMNEDGWNIKFPKRNPDIDPAEDTRVPYLNVAVTFGQYPPRIVLIDGQNHRELNEDTVSVLDWARITNADLIVRPYLWNVNGNSGVKAYLDEAYITIEREGFANKYGF